MEYHLDNDLLAWLANSTYSDSDGVAFDACEDDVPGLDSLGLSATFAVVFVLGLLGNSVVVTVLSSARRRLSSTDVYLLNLAVADLLFSVSLPFWAVYVHRGWIFGGVACKLLSGLQELSVYAGVFLLCCISVDRYVAIVRAARALGSGRLSLRLALGAVWLVAGVLALPMTLQMDSIPPQQQGALTICHENLTGESSQRWRVGVRVVRHSLGFFLPLLVMAVCYGWTAATLFHTRTQQKHKAMRVILAVVAAFLLCWLPHNVVVLVDTLMRAGSLGQVTCRARGRVDLALHVTQVFAFAHCAVNPVLYAFIGQKFRNQLLAMLHRRGLVGSQMLRRYRRSTGSRSSSSGSSVRITSISV